MCDIVTILIPLISDAWSDFSFKIETPIISNITRPATNNFASINLNSVTEQSLSV